MFGVNVKKIKDQLVIRWQFSKIEIPISNITSVTLDDTYGGSEPAAIRIGPVNGTSERILIRTVNQSYILFTNSVNLYPNIQAMLHPSN
ncbi:PH domain-containing protein [Paenibacillus sp. 1781tsa1]|uniref:PH domain-containing protein n=1 Tax=Paenibacillus sp. 1781tsa1 TaxID=2953810 RepID=UPI00209F1F55|nr:PH domain-containing protein [Paenibacillus sp. 1781tsa1]MCP1183053.1 PH domain-containing protein [Paenibacillus sp. 1781tsa1]